METYQALNTRHKNATTELTLAIDDIRAELRAKFRRGSAVVYLDRGKPSAERRLGGGLVRQRDSRVGAQPSDDRVE